ncbi:DUF3656 domain-containing protein [Candidatus Woesearchaeota archaeon]|nr:DUF3656 domain-containing protein [Candidatus Woesearchaeota archaeon]
MKRLTLLAPAGNFEAVVAAVNNGADAIYLGSKLFNARRLAGNFTKDELQKAVQYAHLNGVKVYLTLNTLVKNNEMGPFFNQVSIAHQLGIDALILQDLSFAPLIKKQFPSLEIHASTQATIMNSLAVKYWQKWVDQFVLARELTKQEVRAIADNTKAQLEVFVHGHLCISYSGQCLISSLIGKRSGNRGLCASSCRKQYNGNQYLLSAKDLCMIRNMDDVAESGATTVKIEGRMKSAEYVAVATRAYRDQIDALVLAQELPVDEERMNELKMAFNREFTSGYFNEESTIVDKTYSAKRGIYLGTVTSGLLQLEEDLEIHDGIGIIEKGERSGEYVRSLEVDGERRMKARKGERVKIGTNGFHNGARVYLMTKSHGNDPLLAKQKKPVSISIIVKEGIEPAITISCSNGSEGKTTVIPCLLPIIAVKPEKQPLAATALVTEIKKWQSDIFLLENVKVETDNSFIPKSIITTFRKELDQTLLDALSPLTREKQIIPLPTYQSTVSNARMIHVRVYSLEGVREALAAGADRIYYDAFAHDLHTAMTLARKKMYLHTPMVMRDQDLERLQAIIETQKPAGILVNNVGVLGLGLRIPTILGYQMNIFNDQQLQYYNCPAVASIELNLPELNAFKNKERLIFYAHGTPVVMTFKESFAVSALTDKKEYTFPLRKTSTGATEMLYSKAVGTLQHTPEVLAAGITQLFLDVEKDVFALVSLYKRLLNGDAVSTQDFRAGATIGNLVKGVM